MTGLVRPGAWFRPEMKVFSKQLIAGTKWWDKKFEQGGSLIQSDLNCVT
jgi:hypothetical protein